MFYRLCCLVLLGCCLLPAAQSSAQTDVDQLRAEVAGKGWIVFSARAENGSWDLFLMRPDGSALRNISNTPDLEEAAPRFSPDGRRLLWRAMKRGTVIDHDKWGTQGKLMIGAANGKSGLAVGGEGELPWASWSPDGKTVATLVREGIIIVDPTSGARKPPIKRQGLFQQLFWSPDGKWYTGVANYEGKAWTVVRVNAETGEMNGVRSAANCTPDWFPDSQQIIFSSRPLNQQENAGYGWTFLWRADGSGDPNQLIYGEEGYHIYSGATSPCGTYALFTRCPVDGGGSEKDGAPMYLVRLADTPIIRGETAELRAQFPDAGEGPLLTLPDGWEPHWTYTEIGE